MEILRLNLRVQFFDKIFTKIFWIREELMVKEKGGAAQVKMYQPAPVQQDQT